MEYVKYVEVEENKMQLEMNYPFIIRQINFRIKRRHWFRDLDKLDITPLKRSWFRFQITIYLFLVIMVGGMEFNNFKTLKIIR